jgi:diguanylate cyclase (GGDEF)-like protein
VYLDIDGLKDVNDRYGHDAGDRLIRSVATVLRGVFRPQDTVARIGGDEFAVLLIGADARLTQQLLTSVHQDLHQAGISVSAGTAETDPDSFDAELADLLNQADHNMYTAKTARKKRATEIARPPATAAHDPGDHHRSPRPTEHSSAALPPTQEPALTQPAQSR